MYKFKISFLLIFCLLFAACSSSEPETSGATESAAVAEDSHSEDEAHTDEENHGDEDDHGNDEEHGDDHDDHGDHEDEESALVLPEMGAVALDGRQLKVVATTSIVGDVVSNIGGDSIDLTVLMGVAVDPHSYESTPRDLAVMEEADVIFVNGWDLEERLAADIEENFSDKMVPISAGVTPLEFAGHSDPHDDDEHHDDKDEHADEEHHDDEDEHADDDHHAHNHSGTDPHVWFDIHNIERWAGNVANVLSEADPANADSYESNLDKYIAQLEALEDEIEPLLNSIPSENRKLITNHDALGYFAEAYGFEVVGTVLPSLSTNADPSAGELAELIETMQEAGVCTIFGETTANNKLAETVVAELDDCDQVNVLTIYTGALGNGDASSYIGMFRSNVQTIVDGLQ